MFLVGAFINKKSPTITVTRFFFFFFKERVEAANVNVQVKETIRIPGKRL